MSLQGNLVEMPPENLLRFLVVHAQTGTLYVSSGASQAQICFDKSTLQSALIYNVNDNIVHFQGNDAIQEFLDWQQGEFYFEEDPLLPATNITISLDYLLLEHHRRGDEHEAQERARPMAKVCPALVQYPPTRPEIKLDSRHWRLLLHITGSTPIGRIAQDTGLNLVETVDLIQDLQAMGLVEFNPPETAPPSKSHLVGIG